MVTLKDISLACGVSISTVSKALSDYPDISEETKQRIRAVAGKMGYLSQRMKMEAVRKHTYVLGLLVTGEDETDFHGEIITEIRRLLSEKGYDLVVLSPSDTENSGNAEGERPGYLFRVKMLGLEGVFLFTKYTERSLFKRHELQGLRELILGAVPVVGVDCSFAPCSCVLPDYEDGIRSLVKAAYSAGHRRIAVICGASAGNAGILEKAFFLALHERKIQVPGRFFCRVKANAAREAYARTEELLLEGKWLYPTCILFTDDILMEGGIAAIHNCGAQASGNISVGVMRLSGYHVLPEYPVTAWCLPPVKIAEKAVEVMMSAVSRPGFGISGVSLVKGHITGTVAEEKEPIQAVLVKTDEIMNAEEKI